MTATIWVYRQSEQNNPDGTNLVGGRFNLIDQDGKEVTDNSYQDKFKIVYFGYTYCPDVCPTGLSVISEALDIVGKKADKIKPLFVTVDPTRDTLETLAEYQQHFHPNFSYLTGSPEQITSIANLYKVYFKKTTQTGDYLIDHSAITYVMSPSGGYLTHFGPEAESKQIANFLLTNVK